MKYVHFPRGRRHDAVIQREHVVSSRLWHICYGQTTRNGTEIEATSLRDARIGGGFVWTTVTGGSTISSALSLPLFSWGQRREMRPRDEWGAHSRRALLQFEYDRCPMSYLAHPLPPLSRQERDVSFSA